MSRIVAVAMLIVLGSLPAEGHDIPNARVDRSIQVTLEPGKIRVDFEVGLSELTLVQDLRQLLGELPGTDRPAWFDAYGRETGPMNARGMLVAVDGVEVDLKAVGFDLSVEEHPRYTFHFEAKVPAQGRLTFSDTNFAASDGTSRLAIRGVGVAVPGDSIPAEVALIPIRPVWELSDVEERRTKRLTVDYRPATGPAPTALAPPVATRPTPPADPLARLLDDPGRRGWPVLLMLAMILGAAHAIQPGHGKTLVAASSIGPGRTGWQGAALGLATAMVHLSSVALIAAIAWSTRTSRMGEWHLAMTRVAGFTIAAIGCWRLGRHLGGFGEGHSREHSPTGGIAAMALAGGIVPCWDAVALVVLSMASGRLATGMALLAAFSLGMALVLVGVGALAGRFPVARSEVWERRVGLAGGTILLAIGLGMLWR